MDEYLLGRMTWEDVNDAVREGRVVLVPVGAIEQHGPHLPIDTDNVLVSAVCEQAARAAPRSLLCAPPINYGFNEHNMDFPGTFSIRMDNFVNYCFDVGESLVRQGFFRILWCNGHGSNGALLELVARRLTNETPALSASIDWWQLAWDTISQVCESFPEGVDHACEWETSGYLHLRPDLVRTSKVVDEIVSERGGPAWLYPNVGGGVQVRFMNVWSRMSQSGVNGRPSLATAEKGQQIIESAVSTLVRIGEEFRNLEVASRVDHKIPWRGSVDIGT